MRDVCSVTPMNDADAIQSNHGNGHQAASGASEGDFSHLLNQRQAYTEISDDQKRNSEKVDIIQLAGAVSESVLKGTQEDIGGLFEQENAAECHQSLSPSSPLSDALSPYAVGNSSTPPSVSLSPEAHSIFECDLDKEQSTRKPQERENILDELPILPRNREILEKTPTTPRAESIHEMCLDAFVVKEYYTCNLCDKRFKIKKDLVYHMNKHDGIKPYKCGKCDAWFGNPSLRRQHEQAHAGARPFACKLCSKTYTTRPFLNRHIGAQHLGKRYHCELCDQSFKQQRSLKFHMNRHNDVKPYKCEKCEVSFRGPSAYKIHMKAHAGIQPHVCEVCSKNFTRRGHLERHMEIQHLGMGYNCQLCSKAFKERESLKNHMKNHRV